MTQRENRLKTQEYGSNNTKCDKVYGRIGHNCRHTIFDMVFQFGRDIYIGVGRIGHYGTTTCQLVTQTQNRGQINASLECSINYTCCDYECNDGCLLAVYPAYF